MCWLEGGRYGCRCVKTYKSLHAIMESGFMATRMVLIRHGDTGYPTGTFVGTTDVGLAEGAAEKARRLGEKLRGENINALYTSSMKRARETGKSIGNALGINPSERLSGLNEIDFGRWEMKWWEDVKRENPRDFLKRKQDIWRYSGHGVESWGKVRDRAMPVIEDLLTRHEGETFAIVSHGVTIRIIHAVLLGLSEEEVNSMRYPFLVTLFFKKDGDKIELEKVWCEDE